MPVPSISVSIPDATGVADELTALGPRCARARIVHHQSFHRASLCRRAVPDPQRCDRSCRALGHGLVHRRRRDCDRVGVVERPGYAPPRVRSVGVDADGRHYHQPAFPAFRPAADTIEPTFVAAVDVGIAEVL